jgi:hypothetical protein
MQRASGASSGRVSRGIPAFASLQPYRSALRIARRAPHCCAVISNGLPRFARADVTIYVD